MKEKLICALKRALWTALQAGIAVAVTMIPEGAGIEGVDWLHIASVVAVATILSFLKSVAVGMPEVQNNE